MRKLFSWITQLYKPDTEDTVSNIKDSSNLKFPFSNATEINQTVTGIEWIDNDGLLRDEGVLFGIAQADPVEKVEAIRNGFDKAKAVYEVKRQHWITQINDLFQKKEQNAAASGELKIQILELKRNRPTSSHRVIPFFLQVLAYSGICYFNYYLVAYWLQPVFDDGSLIPLGIYGFGMLSVFLGKALVYNPDAVVQETEGNQLQREKWKVWSEELGIPLVVAAFIAVLSSRSFPIEWSIAAFFLFFFLFSFSGKGLINSFYRFHLELKLVLQFWKQHRVNQHHIRERKRELKSKENELLAVVKSLESTQTALQEPDTKLNELKALLHYKISIFESEYNLAKEAKEQLSPKQMSTF